MSISKIALAVPLALGIACSTTGSQSSDHTGAMWTQREPSDGSMPGDPPPRGAESLATPDAGASQDGLAVQPASGTADAAPVAANDPSSGSGSGAMGSSGSSDSSGSSGSSGSSDSSGSSGGAMGSGGSSETMGSEHEGSSGSSAAAPSPGSTGAHEGDQLVRGKISKLSKDQLSITPKGGKAKTLKINGDTVVTINGKDAKPSQLKPGQNVRASYENVSGDDVAVKIEAGKGMRHGRMKHSGGTSGGDMPGGMHGGGSDTGTPGGSH